jgi:phosphatidylethanolamine/phosphatidyl-N-methylethanolamine N-methyltransferase
MRGTDYDRGRRYWDRHVGAYELSLAVLGKPFPRMLELIRAELEGANEVLEVGAGTGRVTAELAACSGHVVATDYAEEMVARLRARFPGNEDTGHVEVRQADLYELTPAAGRFDVVVAANVLHLVPDLSGALAAVRRVLVDGGKLIAPTFCHGQTWSARLVSRIVALTGFPAHRRLTLDSLVDAIAQSGGSVTKSELIPGLIPVGFVVVQWPSPLP